MLDVGVSGAVNHNIEIKHIAEPWRAGGCSVVPIRPGGSKAPFVDWRTYMNKAATSEEVDFWFLTRYRWAGVAVICGQVSGNLEMLELEGRAADSESLNKVEIECDSRGVGDLWRGLSSNGYTEWTPSGGLHFMYRINGHAVPGNTKLAMRLARFDELNDEELKILANNPDRQFTRCLAETRGEGGYVVVAPTGGHCHKTGEAWRTVAGDQGTFPVLDWEQRTLLHEAVIAALDELPREPVREPIQATPLNAVDIRDTRDLRPGDDFQVRASWEDPWFTNQGWKVSHRVGLETFWTRPGKDVRDGHSASTGYRGDRDHLYVWSTSTGLPAETPCSKLFVYAHYYHNGDLSAAARDLRGQGYGSTSRSTSTDLVPLREYVSITGIPAPKTIQVLPDDSGFDLTDTGNGQRIHMNFADKFRWSTPEKRWYVWSDTHWARDEIQEIQRDATACAQAAREHALRDLDLTLDAFENDEKAPQVKVARKRLSDATAGLNNRRLQDAIVRFSTVKGISVGNDAFNQQRIYLNLPNGTLNLETLQFKEHDPKDMISLMFGACYNPDATAPKFEQFMIDAFPDVEVRDYVQRALGYSLLANPSERAFFVLHGTSGTGKSVITDVMTRIFKDYGTTAPASAFRLKRNETSVDVHRLRGRRYVATSEMPAGAKLDEELVKRITGGDQMSSRGLYEDYQDWRPECVIWIATNYLPSISSDDNAIWRRVKPVSMDTVFGTNGTELIRDYASILYSTEADGILNWILQGLTQYRAQDGLNEPDVIKEAVMSYRIASDNVASWLRDAMTEGLVMQDQDAEISMPLVRNMYEAYCSAQHSHAITGKSLANRLQSLGLDCSSSTGIYGVVKGLRHNPAMGTGGVNTWSRTGGLWDTYVS